MFFLIEGINDNTEGIGLSREALLRAAESRLRAARLYPDGLADLAEAATAQLFADIHVVGPVVHVSLVYRKKVTRRVRERRFREHLEYRCHWHPWLGCAKRGVASLGDAGRFLGREPARQLGGLCQSLNSPLP